MSTNGTAPPNRVREIRVKRYWTLSKLETLTGLDHTHLSRIERGVMAPSDITKQRIADALGMEVAAVFPPEPVEVAS